MASSYKRYLEDHNSAIPHRSKIRHSQVLRGSCYKAFLENTGSDVPYSTQNRWATLGADKSSPHNEGHDSIPDVNNDEEDNTFCHIEDDRSSDQTHSGFSIEEQPVGNCSGNVSESDFEMNHERNETCNDKNGGENDPLWDERPAYEGSKMSYCQGLLLIIFFIIRHSLTKAAVTDLLELINLFVPQGEIAVPETRYMFYKSLNLSPDDSLHKHYICPLCTGYLGESNEEQALACGVCDKEYDTKYLRENFSFFIVFPLESQFQNKLKDTEFVNNINFKWQREKKVCSNIEDIYDGKMYKAIKDLNDPKRINFSLSWNTDGAPIFKSSNFSVWPIQCCINELPPKLRQKHKLLPGLWFNKIKPSMNSFFRPFVEECLRLEKKGFVWYTKAGEKVCSRVFTVLCICDSVARCLVQNTKQFNGEYGCTWCYQKGDTLETGNGHVRVYPFQQVPPAKRTHDSVIRDATTALNTGQASHMGVKGVSPLAMLNSFNMVSGFSVDYMHCVLLGTVRHLVQLWFDSEHHSQPWYIGRRVKEVDERILKISPPDCMLRLPRSLTSRKYWKASEFKNFLLYYSVPCLKYILPTEYFNHLLLLVNGIYTLLLESVSEEKIQAAHCYLSIFHKDFQTLYGLRHMTYNLHLLTHICQCVVDWGPLWGTSAFSYEDGNRILVNLFHGTQQVAVQIMTHFSLLQQLPKLVAVVNNSEMCEEFEEFLGKLCKNPVSVKRHFRDGVASLAGKSQVHFITAREKKLLTDTGIENCKETCLEYSKVIVNGFLVNSKEKSSSSRRCNFAFQLINGDFVIVKRILHIVDHESILLTGYPLTVEHDFFVKNNVQNCKLPFIHAVTENRGGIRIILPSELLKPVLIFHKVHQHLPDLIVCSPANILECS